MHLLILFFSVLLTDTSVDIFQTIDTILPNVTLLPVEKSNKTLAVIFNYNNSSDKATDSLHNIDTDALKTKYFTELKVVAREQYCFCENIMRNQCKDSQFGILKSQYAASTSRSILKKHVKVCFERLLSDKKNFYSRQIYYQKKHHENLALMIVENMVFNF